MKIRWTELIKLLVFIALSSSMVIAQNQIDGSPHDLTAVAGGKTSCSFCHTPHGALTGTPLWSHKLSTAVYKIYQSSSLEANVGQPTGSSKLCLSCHDGTVALAESVNSSSPGGAYINPGAANLGTDLSDDHPISFVYSAALSAEDVQIRPPSGLPEQLKLDGAVFNITAAAQTEQHCALRAVVGAPVRAADIDHAIRICFSNRSARLVAVGAQVSFAAVIDCVFQSEEHHRGGGLQSPVRGGVAGVDLVAGAAVLAGRVGISNLDCVWGEPLGNHSAEAAAGVTSDTTGACSTLEGFTGSMHGLAPAGLLPGDQRRVIVADRAANVLS